jgi:hypothetical protein
MAFLSRQRYLLSRANMGRLSLIVLLLAACAGPPVVNAADAERIVVTNVRLVGRDAAAQDTAVNVPIVGGRLAVVMKDELVIEPGDTALDSNGGFLFGQLALA